MIDLDSQVVGKEMGQQMKIAIEDLDFRYGNVGFEYNHIESSQLFDFEIENDEFRLEFDVLKPYFVKVLKSKSFNIANLCRGRK